MTRIHRFGFGKQKFEADDGAKVAILTGEGRVFCAGADLKEMAETGKTIPGGQAIPILGRTLHVSKVTWTA